MCGKEVAGASRGLPPANQARERTTQVHLDGGPAPVRRFLPELIQLIWDRKINPGKVFDLTLPLEEAAEGYRAMDTRRATKVLLTL
jgi:threonine dehydrogenase-like Zn-dependent dehydrogenase